MNLHPVTLTFVAPAANCNQKCPGCAIALRDEPVHEFDLTPEDYLKFASDFYDAGVPIQAISFQGYEVTLPRSWPYLEAVFRKFGPLGAYQGFVTNGMLLHKYAHQIRDLNIARIGISIDGSDAETNDHFRGLRGALKTTTDSIRKFLEIAPDCADKITIASVIWGDRNAQSLTQMPKLIRELGLGKWTLSNELVSTPSGYLEPKGVRWDVIERCREAAAQEGVDLYISDEFGYIDKNGERTVNVRQLLDKNAFLRLVPTGHVYCGKEALGPTTVDTHKWNPATDAAKLVYGDVCYS
jgi:MoaA/NifB/PqqE/SkfB family radical SAM enzyme